VDNAKNMTAETTMKRHRKGMTLIELLVVIAIVGVLATLSVWGIASFMIGGSTRDTRVLLSNCTAMLEELRLANNLQGLPTLAIQAPTSVTDAAPERLNHPAIIDTTAKAFARMKALPASRKAMEKLPSDRLMSGASVPDHLKGLPLDGWGNPILYVPAEGMFNVRVNNNNMIVRIRSSGAVQGNPALTQSDRPFFASAGPDGRFDTGDDNLYSFEN
jgi:prepilin-type N-terminal cleavage/methylation domain-containing protein